MSLWIQTGCREEEEVESKMCEGGKFQKAAAAKEELGETDAPPSYGGAHTKNTSGGAAGCRGFYRQTLVNIPVMSPVIP